jgi:hypothetical protein
MNLRRIVLLLIIGTVAFLSWSCWRDNVAHGDFERLLRGDKDISLQSLEIGDQGRGIIIDDPESMKYLSEALRSSERGKAKMGASYDMCVRLSTGARVKCAFYAPKAKDNITIHFPIDSVNDGVMYLVTLPEPVPKRLSAIIAQLRSDD